VALQPVRLPNQIRTSTGGASGLLVIMVEPGGPAEKAGLIVGDIVLALGDKPLKDPADLQAELDPEYVGKTIVLHVLRGGNALDVPVTVGERAE
jgi:S1-C subfamily serine protease